MALERPGWLFPYRAKDITTKGGSCGYVYVMRTPDIPYAVKIGFTRRCPVARAKELSSQTGNLHGFAPLLWFKITDVEAHEKSIFAAMEDKRVKPNKEFFRISDMRVCIALEEYFERKPDWVWSELAERVAVFRTLQYDD